MEIKMGKPKFKIRTAIALPAILFSIFLAASLSSYAQDGSVGIGTEAPDRSASAILYLNSNNKGFLAPLVAGTASITTPTEGLLIYVTGDGFWYYNGTYWVKYSPPLPALSAGDGLDGTAYTGASALTWNVDYAGDTGLFGSATTVARSDHYHQTLSPQDDAGLLGGDYDGSGDVSNWRVNFESSGGNFGTSYTVARSDHSHDGSDLNLGTLSITDTDVGLVGDDYDGSGNVNNWNVNWGGSTGLFGTASSVARSDHYHQNLTAGDGLFGNVYNGNTATTWSVDLETLSPGTGLTGDDYDGTTGVNNWSVIYGGDGSLDEAARSDHTHTPDEVNLENLTPSGLISGPIYNGNTATTWSVSLETLSTAAGGLLSGNDYDGTGSEIWSVTLLDHTPGDGFTAGSGIYNGVDAREWDLNFTTPPGLFNGTTTTVARGDHTHAGMLTGGGTQYQVAYWDPTNELTGDGNFTWDGNVANIIGSFSISGGSGSNNFRTAVGQTGNVAYTLPDADGLSGEVLSTNGSGVLSWAAAGDDGDWTISGNNIFSAVSGNVGIGTSSPGAKLDVIGASSFTGDMTIEDGNLSLSNSGTANQLFFEVPGGANYTSFNAQTQTDDINYTLPSTAGTIGQVLTTDNSSLLSWATPDDNDWVINETDMYSNTNITNVGIGTASPSELLEIEDGNLLLSNTNTASTLSFMEPNSSGSDESVTTFSAVAQTGDIHYTWPAEQGASGSVTTMTNDGDGSLSWMTAGDFDKTKNVTVVTNTNYTATNDDYYIIVNTSGTDDYDVNLPPSDEGKVYFIKATGDGTGTVSIIATIDGSSPLFLDQANKESVMLLSDGTQWYIMSRYKED
jgi:hypothetical protein